MIKGSIQQKDLTVINIYVPKSGAPIYIVQILPDINGEIDSNTVIVVDFNTPFIWVLSRQKIQKERVALNNT